MVKHELQDSVRVAETDDFLDKLLPVDEATIAAIFEILQHKKLYNSHKRKWTSLPNAPKHETDLYKPFTDLLNAINEACQPGMKTIQASWLDRHSKAPKSNDPDAPAIRPDIISVLGALKDVTRLEMEIQETAGTKKKKGKAEKKIVEELTEAWWSRVHIAIEMKLKTDSSDAMAVVQQLCGYMRQIFREQLDRKSVFGLAFCGFELSVWLCDRSGLLGMKESINVHKHPKKFIQVIAAFALLSPEHLGWDTSMQLFRPTSDPALVHSWQPEVTPDDFRQTLQDTHWAISMPSRDGTSRELFITTGGISLVRSEIMCGRATLIWEAIKYEELMDRTVKMPQRFVLKHYWVPQYSTREAEFYAHTGDGCVAKVYSSEDVFLGDVAILTSNIRNNLVELPPIAYVPQQTIGKRDREEIADMRISICLTGRGTLQFGATSQSKEATQPRVLSRLLLETYGWPVKFFSDVRELLTTMQDAISGHQEAYYRGVLHRDLSVGNIVICPNDNVCTSKTRGALIDFDYAKLTEKFFEDKGGPALDRSSEDYQREVNNVNWVYPGGIAADAFNAIYTLFDGKKQSVSGYVQRVVEHFFPATRLQQNCLDCKDLGIYPQTRPRPDFSEHKPQPGPRTATLAYASHEILSGLRYDGNIVVDHHDSIHDLESFFWILVYLCLTREGPGGKRRNELTSAKTLGGPAESLEQIVYCFFDSNDKAILSSNRARLFGSTEDMKDVIVKQFHPYFRCLIPLILEWWRLLHIAYTSPPRLYNTMYQPFLESILDAIKVIEQEQEQEPSEQHPATTAEFERRRQDLARIKVFCDLVRQPVSHPLPSSRAFTRSPDRATSHLDRYNSPLNEQPPSLPPPPPKKHRFSTLILKGFKHGV